MNPTNTHPAGNTIRLTRAILSVAIILLHGGCGFNSTPACNDDDVIDILRDLSKEDVWPHLGPLVAQNEPDAWSSDVPYLVTLDRNRLASAAKTDPEAKRMFDAMDRQFDRFGLTFSGFRTNDQNHEIRKSWCGVQFTMSANGKTIVEQMEYTAQYTDDGHVYIEITK